MQTQQTETPDLLSAVDAHCAATGLKKSAFGELAVGDPSFVFDLEAGREPRRRTVARVMSFIETGETWEQHKAKASSSAGAA